MPDKTDEALSRILTQLDEIRAENKELRAEMQEFRRAVDSNTEQIAGLANDLSVMRDDVALLKSESEVRDYQLGYPLTRAVRDHQLSLRTAGYSMYAGGPVGQRRAQVPPPTEPARSGVSFKPGHRKLGAARYD